MVLTRVTSALVLLALSLASVLVVSTGQKKSKEKSRMSAPFWLQDAADMSCLRPEGFGACDIDALWILAPRGKRFGSSLVSFLEGDPKTSCLERVGGGKESATRPASCNKAGAKRWDLLHGGEGSIYYVTEGEGKKTHCLVRGSSKDPARNLVSTMECRKGASPLLRVPTQVNSEGFLLQTIDGKCFDGESFRTCSEYDRSQLFGIGLQFSGGEATRSLFHFRNPEACVNRSGKKVVNGDCKSKSAMDWSLEDGMLMHAKNKYCLVRLRDDTAEMRPCKDNVYEYLDIASPKQSQAAAAA